MTADLPASSPGPPPDSAALGPIVAEHIVPILYALERVALLMQDDGREEEARYYRALAEEMARARK